MTLTAFTVFLHIIIATMTTAPVSARVIHISFEESSGAGSGDTDVKTEFDIDLGELAVEYIQNGTQKKESFETLIDINQRAQNKNMSESHVDSSENNLQRARRNIFGDDGRLLVDNSNYLPYCAVGYLDTGCTAAFIGPYHALTAAHCVYDIATNTWKQNLNLWRGRTCSTNGQRMYWARVWSVTGYTDNHRPDHDYALIIYNQKNRSPCWLSFGYWDIWPDVGFDIFGYPEDKLSVSGCSYNSMWFTSCHYSDTLDSGRRYKYRCDTLPGNSGSALYAEKKGDSSGSRVVYGVHTHGAGTTIWNYGNRIDKSRFCQIVQWMKDSGYTPMCGSSACCS